MRRERITQLTVLEWLKTNHYHLFETAAVDREWVWITESLKPPHEKCACDDCAKLAAVRKSVGEYGFVFARRLHVLPDARLGTWGHACLKPIPFHRGRNKGGTERDDQTSTDQQPQPESADAVRRAALAFLDTLN
jgi:hypothetical protein